MEFPTILEIALLSVRDQVVKQKPSALIFDIFCRDNYGFVTYAYKDDAYEAVEHGNDNPALTQYDLSFGGRRSFCKQRYADLGKANH